MAKVVFLLGSGASATFGLPTMVQLTSLIEREFQYVSDVKKELEELGFTADIEAILTVLNDAANGYERVIRTMGPSVALITEKPEKPRFTGKIWERLAKELWVVKPIFELGKIKETIWDRCSISENDPKILKVANFYHNLFEELEKQPYTRAATEEGSGKLEANINLGNKWVPLDLFTTNYDLLIERMCDSIGIECSRGVKVEEGAIRREVFDPNAIQSTLALCLFKLHGSLDFYIVGDEIQRFPAPPKTRIDAGGRLIRGELMIYPIHAKYVYSYPYFNMFSQLYEKLARSAACVIIGHSMRDEAINDVLTAAMIRNRSLKLVIVNIDPKDVCFLNMENKFISKERIQERTNLVVEGFGTEKCLSSIIEALGEDPGITI